MKFWWRQWRNDHERELEEELDVHFAIDIQQRMQAGLEQDEAQFAARRDFGNLTRVKEVTREVANPMLVFETILLDLRYGARMLYRNVGFTAVAIFALTVGIGVNTAVFTAYKAMVGRPVDAHEAENIVNIALIRPSGAADFQFSYPDYEAYRDSIHSFSGVIAFDPEQMTLSAAGGIISQRSSAAESVIGKLGLLPYGASNAEFASVFVVSENYFKVLGVLPLRGRTFESLTIPDLIASPSVLISENYWEKRFAGNPAVLGTTIRLNATAVQIIGITPHNFVGTAVAVPDFWVPLNLEPLLHGDRNWLRDRENQCCRVFARLASGVSIHQAQAEVAIMADHLRALHDPHSEVAKTVNALVWPGSPLALPLRFYRGLELTILLVMLAAAMLLAVACANVGSLQVARARSRQNELRTRLSLGASRKRILRQLLTESALLAMLAGALALLFTWALLKISVALYAAALPAEFGTFIFNVTPDLQIFGYVFAISLLAGILFGLAPALESSSSAISSAARGSTSPVSTRRVQDFLITAQVSLSLVLMIAGSMLIRSAIHSLNMEPGYATKHLVSLNFQFAETPRYSAERKLAVARELRARLAALPGVVGVTSAHSPQDSGFRTAAVTVHQGKASAQSGQSIMYYTYVQPNYFETLGIPLFLGRGFQSHGESFSANQPRNNSGLMKTPLGVVSVWAVRTSGRTIRKNFGPTVRRIKSSALPATRGAWSLMGATPDRFICHCVTTGSRAAHY